MENREGLSKLPGYRLSEYLLVISPHEELAKRITHIREEFAGHYNLSARLARPAVTLAGFTQREMMEERIKTRLRMIAMGFPPFRIELKDYGSFPSHTIYMQVATKTVLQQLVREIRKEAQRLMKADEEHKPLFIMEPHITIANRLKPWQYEKGWLEYSRKHFTGKLIASSMSLLKKPAGETRFYLLEKMEFQNLPVITKQGALF